MKRKLEVCSLGVFLMAGALSAQMAVPTQNDDWQQLMERGKTLERAANYSQAAASYRDAVKIAEAFSSPNRRLLLSLNSLALAYDEMGWLQEAERYFRRALAMLDAADENCKLDRALVLANLALLYREEGQIQKSGALLQQAVAIETETLQPDDVRLTVTRAALAELLLIAGNYREAEPLFEDLLATFQKRPEAWQQQIGIVLSDLGVVRQFQGRKDEAIRLFEQSMAILEAKLGAGHLVMLRPLVNLAKVTQSDELFRRAVAIAEERLGPEHPAYSDVLLSYAAFLRATGHKREAKVLEARSKSARQENARRDGVGLTVDVSAFRP